MTTDPKALIERLERKAYRRELWHEPYGCVDVPCDADDHGAEEYFVNPDGPAASQALRDLTAENERLKALGNGLAYAIANGTSGRAALAAWENK